MSVISNVKIKLTVISSTEIGSNSMVVSFKRPIGFEYEAGDWIDLMKPGVELRGGKTYSLSSSPTEGELAIMFRVGLSPLKQHLQSLKPGDELTITDFIYAKTAAAFLLPEVLVSHRFVAC
jgi:ferredoxin-NADP reductase